MRFEPNCIIALSAGTDLRLNCDLPQTTSKSASAQMKPAPAPHVPGKTEAERFDNAVRKMFTVSKEDYLKEEARLKRIRERKKKRSK